MAHIYSPPDVWSSKIWPFPFGALTIQFIVCRFIKPRPINSLVRIFEKSAKRLSDCISKSKRNPNAAPTFGRHFFDKEKIFLDLFWHHLFEKPNWRGRVRRLRYHACALELIKNPHYNPNITKNPNVPHEVLYRFYGATADNELCCVQIKENLKKKQNFLISVFPAEGPIFY